AREDVFIAALDVHRAFIENNPVKMAANIGLAMDRSGLQQMNEGSCQHHGFMSAGERRGKMCLSQH
ncbi:hypothetical protein CP989_25385, partial [Enterobacter hormaechei]|uniref:hypothetical protein n=1 Tax=Enterobacter hormaechei TaxID=158836 RepID=UPI000BDCD0AF